MERFDTVRPEDQVNVTVFGPDGNILLIMSDTGYHNLESVVKDVIDSGKLEVNPEDCVFEIHNESTGAFNSYRINAHGNLKLIV